jgi:hypothetical protein
MSPAVNPTVGPGPQPIHKLQVSPRAPLDPQPTPRRSTLFPSMTTTTTILIQPVHGIGSGPLRHWRSWEVADIGVLVMFRRKGKLYKSKSALLQSKRLYPNEQPFEEDEPVDY